MSARISLARARALYEGPPQRSLSEVAREIQPEEGD